jgi:hypothetical protein
VGVPTLEVGYTSVTAGRGDHEVRKGHVVTLGKKKFVEICKCFIGQNKVDINLSHFNLFCIVTKFALTPILILFTHLLPYLTSFRFAEQFLLPAF